jgi:hypothetical protein
MSEGKSRESVREDVGSNHDISPMPAESDGWKHKPDPSAINHDHYRSHKGHEGEKHLSVPATVEEDTHVGSPLNGLPIRRSKSDAGR